MIKHLFATFCGLILIAFGSTTKAETPFEEIFASQKYRNVQVENVLSVDLIRLTTGKKIKLIGLKGPEAPSKRRDPVERNEYGMIIKEEVNPLTTVEEEAIEYVEELLLNRDLRIEMDVQRVDDEQYTLGYAFLIDNDLFVNTEILRQGYAHLQISPPNLKYADQLRAAYQEAHRERRGLQSE